MMKRSLAFKLTLAFILVSLAGAILSAFFIWHRTQNEFNNFLTTQEKDSLIEMLQSYYQENNSWDNVVQYLTDKTISQINIPHGNQGEGFGKMKGRHTDYLLLNQNKAVVFGEPSLLGQVVSADQGYSIEVNGVVVGWLVPKNQDVGPNHETLENEFLSKVNESILVSAIIAVVIAVILGAALARALMRPLKELTTATQIVADGKLGYQVNVKSKEEIGNLATSFNKMSADLAKSIQARRQMTADIAHDLRTPLSVITGYTEALSDGKLEGSQEIYDVMHQEAVQLNHLVEDLRLLSLADAGELTLNLQSILPETMLIRAAATMKAQADQKNVRINVSAENGLPYVNVDPDRIAQVLGNLMSNALRYTPEGGWINLKAGMQGKLVFLKVQDNGAGIAPEDLPHIFDRFYRGSKSRQESGESGLGLAIAKSIIQAHGGSISVESQPGVGSEFTILLPGSYV